MEYPVTHEWKEIYCHNKTGTHNVWAQDINNDKIHARNFIIDRPPTISIQRPQPTNLCIEKDYRQLHYSQTQERDSRDWWIHYNYGLKSSRRESSRREPQGPGVQGTRPKITKAQVANISKQYQNSQPWLYGVDRNVEVESDLMRLGDEHYLTLDLLTGPYVRRLDDVDYSKMTCQHQTPVTWRHRTKMINMCPPYSQCDQLQKSTHHQQCLTKHKHHHDVKCSTNT